MSADFRQNLPDSRTRRFYVTEEPNEKSIEQARACPWYQRLLFLYKNYKKENTDLRNQRLTLTCTIPVHGQTAQRLVHHFEYLLRLPLSSF